MTRKFLIALLLSSTPLAAQVAPARLSVPDAEHVLAPPKIGPALPSAGALPAPSVLPQEAVSHLHFTDVEIEGAHVLPARTIAALFQPLQDKDITSSALKPVLDAVAALYLKAGFPLGRAMIPAQTLQDGVLTVKVVEGYIGAINVTAGNARTKKLIERLAARLTRERPLTLAGLERVILAVQDIPGLMLSSRFEDTDPATGATRLVLDAKVQTFALSFSLDNRSGLAGLPTAPYAIASLNNLLGTGDQLTLTTLLSDKPNRLFFGGHGYDFAFQAIAGVSYALTHNVELGAEYRFMDTMDTDAQSQAGAVRYRGSQNQILMASIRWYPFAREEDAPPPAPPPPAPVAPMPPAPVAPPPPPPVRTFIVFFDFDKSEVNPAAMAIVNQAVKAVKQHGFVRVLISGHADTVGSMRYNQRLSEKRAMAVKSAMVDLGVPGSQIATLGKSFSDPLVATGPNVREPQNRRAVIDLDR